MYSDAAYSPFGEPYAQAGTSDLSFTGENQDTVPGLYDFPFREYATQGRWPSPDPAGLAAVSLNDPRTWNRYAYVLNDPLARWDDGMSSDDWSDWGWLWGIGGFGDVGGFGWLSGIWVPAPRPGPFFFEGLDRLFANGCVPDNEEPYATGFICGGDGGHGGGPGGPGGSGSANNLVPANPCQYAGRALDPSAYASQGSSDNGHPMTILLNSVTGFPRGHFFDAQPLTGAPAVQAAAYGNYVFGVYMAAAGVPLSRALFAGNGYAFLSRAKYSTTKQGPMDPNYRSLPAASVANITNGYNAQKNGTVCSKQPLFPPPSAPPF